MQERNEWITATDGFPLAATAFEPEAGRALAAVVISAAMGTPRGFYARFARFLAERGHAVVTYDYRGIGESRPASLRGFDARMRDWVEKDMPAVIEWTHGGHPAGALFHVGHSIGGQLAGLLANGDRIDAMVTVSAQSGYWGLHAFPERYRVWLFVHLGFQALTAVLGYLPWRRMVGGEDMPAGVALEWARWARSPGYVLDDPTLPVARFARFTAPILAYSFTDDVWGSARSVAAMMSAYTAARVELRDVSPAGAGVERLGHVGFFRPAAVRLWEEVAAWLERISKS